MDFVEQSVRDIRYIFTEEDLDISLTELKKTNINVCNVNMDIAILGESHKIKFSGEGFSFTEVVACLGGETDILPTQSSRKVNNVSYLFQSRKSKIYTDSIKETNDLFKKKSSKDILEYDLIFESRDSSKYKAITAIYIREFQDLNNVKKISIKTLHTYPNEDTCLVTETIIGGIK